MKKQPPVLWKNYKYAVIAADVVIMTIENDELKILLIKAKKEPFVGMWAIPGGLVQVDESVDDAAKRHLYNKTGLKNVYMEQLYTFGEVSRDPLGRVVAVAYMALLPNAISSLKTSEGYEAISWFPVKGLQKLAFDHNNTVKTAINRLKSKIEYTNIAHSLLPKEFALSELQKVYEIILERKIDKRNFRKKVISLGVVKETSRIKTGTANRPARLYKFSTKSTQEVHLI